MLALRAKADRGCFFNRTPIFSEFLFFRYLKQINHSPVISTVRRDLVHSVSLGAKDFSRSEK
uniref:Uncharacterized protein n=1 Tax=Candidatus Kentrum sp. TUN TaxID=2126343 RepID=A0A450ZDQ5_9GAMM|nr:MAG: hypothetical protein BECKTUN1418E_GA0071001_10041 [Candidatus Kentron sp. TUN]VFK51906.1 MAG: hypothetical protein BECKTUN1418F_GA0071002_10041 [Candidatus Kentron sp. TUN]